MIKVEQKYSGQYWITQAGQSTYAVGVVQAAELLGYTIDEVRRLVVETEAEAIA